MNNSDSPSLVHVLDFVTHQYSPPIPNFTAGLEALQLITNSDQTATVLYR